MLIALPHHNMNTYQTLAQIYAFLIKWSSPCWDFPCAKDSTTGTASQIVCGGSRWLGTVTVGETSLQLLWPSRHRPTLKAKQTRDMHGTSQDPQRHVHMNKQQVSRTTHTTKHIIVLRMCDTCSMHHSWAYILLCHSLSLVYLYFSTPNRCHWQL